MSKNFSILLSVPNLRDATSFYRGGDVFAHLSRQDYCPEVNFHMAEGTSIYRHHLSRVNAVFLQRPYRQDHLELVEFAKSMRRLIWIDYDDDLFSVPTDNPAHKIYSQTEVQKRIAKMIAMADVVTVSTANLKAKIESLNYNIKVIPNAFNEEYLGYRHEKNLMERKLIFWRGSSTHDRDIACFENQIYQLKKEHPDWTWHFCGYNYWRLSDLMGNNCITTEPVPVIDYHKMINSVKPSIFISPLAPNDFNKSKSNIAWLEAIFAGALAVCPDWDGWRKPGAFNYDSPEQFYGCMKDLIQKFESDQQRKEMAKCNMNAWDYIKSNLTLHRINQKRANIISQLMINWDQQQKQFWEKG